MTKSGREKRLFKVFIVEDTPGEADELRGFVERYGKQVGEDFQVEVLASALEFVNSRRSADLVLMDIDMPGINGMEAAEIFRGYDAATPLIFVTNLAQYAVRGYSVDALDFVVKPVEYPDFAMRMDRALRVMRRNAQSTIALPTSEGVRVIPLSDLVFIDMLKHDVCYHLADGSVLRERGSMREAAEQLGEKGFLKISSGCLINMACVVRVGGESVEMADGTELYFSRSQRKRALETLANYLGRSI